MELNADIRGETIRRKSNIVVKWRTSDASKTHNELLGVIYLQSGKIYFHWLNL